LELEHGDRYFSDTPTLARTLILDAPFDLSLDKAFPELNADAAE